MKAVRFLVIPLLLVCVVSTSYSQFADYKPLRSIGVVPEDFIPDRARYNDLANDIKTKKDKKLFNQYAQVNEYSISNQLSGGYVLYGTVINQYINAVADKLLESNPTLRAKLRFYVIQNSEVNAYTYGNGVIMVSTALIAHLKNEAQLAFILSHEITHYIKGHSFKEYAVVREIDEEANRNRYWDVEDVLAYTSYSKEQETEADQEGFKLYYQSQYALDESYSALEMISYASFPFDSTVITKQFFESPYLKIPKKYFSDTIFNAIDISEEKNENDTFQTHPAIHKRKQLLKEEVGLVSKQPERKIFLVSESEFNKVRDICRFELSRIYLIEKQYINSLYNTYLLLQKYPNNVYLNSCLVKSIYFIQHYTNRAGKSKVVRKAKKIKGEIAKVHFLFVNMKKDELNAWCLRKAWDIHTQLKNDEEIWLFTKQITKEYQREVSTDITFFLPLAQYNDSLIASFYEVIEKEAVSELQKKNRGKKLTKVRFTAKGSFVKYAMPDYLNNDEFVTTFKQLSAEVVSTYQKGSDEEEEESEPKKRKREKKNTVHANADKTTINKILLVDLINVKVDYRKKIPAQYNAIKELNASLVEHIKWCAQLNNIEVETLLPFSITEKDTDLMPHRGLLRMFLLERSQSGPNEEYLATDYKTLQELSAKYKTEHVAFMYNIATVEKKSLGLEIFKFLLTALYFPPAMVSLVYELFQPEEESDLGMVVYNLKNGKVFFQTTRHYEMHLKKDYAKSEFYNLFYKIKLNEN